MLEATRLYVEGLSSYRVVSRLLAARHGRAVSAMTLNRWVLEVAKAAKTPLEVSAQLAAETSPRWGGFLGVDGKAIWIRGEKHAAMVAVDHPSQDVVHAAVAPAETGERLVRLVTEAVTEAGYPLKGLVTDLAPGYRQAIRNYFGELAHQACRVHADRRLDQYIRKSKADPETAAVHAQLKDRIRAILYAPTLEDATLLYHRLLADRDNYPQLGRRLHPGTGRYDPIGALENTFDLYMTHHRNPGMPADNNIAENVIRQLGKKLRLMEGLATTDNAADYLRLLIGCYRHKPFTDSHNGHNGQSPLQLAGLHPPPTDWLTHLLQPPTAT